MKTRTFQATLLASSFILGAALIPGWAPPALAADIMRENNNSPLNLGAAWVGGVAPGTGDIAVWDSTVSAANLTNNNATGNMTWGAIRISNTVAAVNITNDTVNNRQLLLRPGAGTNAINLTSSADFIIGVTLNNQIASTWNIAANRELVMPGGRTTTIQRSVTLAGTGTIRVQRTFNIASNSVFTITNGMTITNHLGSPNDILPGAAVMQVGTTSQGGTVNQTGGSVTLTRTNTAAASTLVVGQVDFTNAPAANPLSFYNLSGGTLDTTSLLAGGDGPGTTVIGDGTNHNAAMNVSGTAEWRAMTITMSGITGAVSTLTFSNNAVLIASNITVGARGPATLTIANNASVTFSNGFTLAGTNAAAPNTSFGSGTVNLNGGTLTVPALTRGGPNGFPFNFARFNFNGGVLRPMTNSAQFVSTNVNDFILTNTGVVVLRVLTNGAIIDTDGWSITNHQPLLHASGANPDGGLTKRGAGSLTLLGSNTYSGLTLVTNGGLTLATTHIGAGPIATADGSTLGVRRQADYPTLTNSAITIGHSAGAALTIDLTTNGNPTEAVIRSTNVTVIGTCPINIEAEAGLAIGVITLIDADTFNNGGGNFVLGTLPLGVAATLITNGQDIQLNIATVPLNLTWNGLQNGSWEIGGPTNWTSQFLAPAAYGAGSIVRFDDSATGTRAITLNFAAEPGGFDLTVSNSSSPYSITGTGSFNGVFTLTKDGTSSFTLGTVSNEYTGGTLINAGTLQLAASEALPHGAGRGNILINGTLDLNGNIETVNGLDGSGVINNSAASPATFVWGTNGVGGTNEVTLGATTVSNVGLFNGVIQNTGAPLTIWKSGGGTTVLNNTNSYTGGTVISAGTLVIPDGPALGGVANPMTLGGTLFIAGGGWTNSALLTMRANSTMTITNSQVILSGNVTATNLDTGFNLIINGGGSFTMNGSSGIFSNLLVDHGTAAFNNTTITNTDPLGVGRGSNNVGVATFDNATFILTDINAFLVGSNSNARGTVFLTNNTYIRTRDFFIAKAQATGEVYQSSGTLTNDEGIGTAWRIAGNAAGDSNAVGTYNLSGGRIDVLKAFQIGYGGTGTLNITGGEANVWSNTTSIGLFSNSVGMVHVSGTGSFNNRSNSSLVVGNGGKGTLTVTNGGLVTSVGQVLVGNSNNVQVQGTVNLGTGGTLRTLRVTSSNTNGAGALNFLGGTLEANASTATFFQNLGSAQVSSLGGTISSGTFDVTATQNLSGTGTLTKSGSGTLALAGSNNTHSGSTVVSAGRLLITPSYRGTSAVTANDGTSFGARVTGSAESDPSEIDTVTMGSSGPSSLHFDLGPFGNPSNAVLKITNITLNGTVNVNISGANLVASATPIILLDYDTVTSGDTNQIVLGSLPSGVTAHLEYNVGNTSIDLVIDALLPTVWNGTADNVWDIESTVNWKVGGLDTTFFDGVTAVFDDSVSGPGGSSITIASNVIPGNAIFSNTLGVTYTISGPGRITGVAALTKVNTGVAILSVSNDYTGTTLISGGTLRLGTNEVLPNVAGASNVTVNAGGTLDLNGFNDTINGLAGNGTVDNTGATNANLTIGRANTTSSFAGTLQNTGSPLSLTKLTASTNELAGASTHSGGTFLTAGRLEIANNAALGVGALTLNNNTVVLAPNGSRTITNSIFATNSGISIFNTANGDLTLDGPVIYFDGDLSKQGVGTLTFGANASVGLSASTDIDVDAGSLVVNGGTVTLTNADFSLNAGSNATSVSATLQGGGSLNLLNAADLRLGDVNGTTNDITVVFTNTFTLLSGTISLDDGLISLGDNRANAGVFNHNGGTVTSINVSNTGGLFLCNASNTSGAYNLNGGTLTIARIRSGTNLASDSTFVFNGGTLRALHSINGTTFMQGLTNALISIGGAVIDTDTNIITINQNISENPSSTGGGLTKLGSGTLALGGTNTYGSNTVVSLGKLFITPTFSSAGTINVDNGAGFGVRRTSISNITCTANVVNLGAGGSTTFDFEAGGFGNPTNAMARITNLTANGTVTVNLSGANFTVGIITLVSYDSLGGSGFGALTLGDIPRGMVASLVDNSGNNSIDLDITAITPIVWKGRPSDTTWDINTTSNWFFNGTNTVFLQLDPLLFDDTATNFTVNIVTNVSPGSMIFSNNANDYLITGSNRITGTNGLTKLGTAVLTIANTNNDYIGVTLISQGTLRLGTNDVLPNGANRSNVVVDGTLDLNGFNETIMGLDGSGVVNNTGASNVNFGIGTNNSSGSYSGAIQDTGGDLRLEKFGTGTNVLLSASTWNGGVYINTGVLAFGHDSALGVGTVTVDDGGTLATFGGARALTNTVAGSTNTGDANINTDAGDLTLTGPVDWPNNDLNKQGGNTLRFQSNVVTMGAAAELAVRGGSVIIDGASISTGDGMRLYASTNQPIVDATLQNNGSLNCFGGANFILGRVDDTNFATRMFTNTFTLTSGQISVSNGGVFVGNNIANVGIMNHNGGTVGFSSTANTNGVLFCNNTNTTGIYNLNGGTLTTPRVRRATDTNGVTLSDTVATFAFDGGTLRALNANFATNFVSGIDNLLVRSGGAGIDSDIHAIAINQALTEDGGSPGGGLVKLGSGALYLNGTNTYTGLTIVTNGTLAGNGSIAGSVVVGPAGRIGAGASIGTFNVGGSVTIIGGATMEINKTGVTLTADKIAAISGTTQGGVLTVTATGDELAAGDSFDLFDGAISGAFSSFELPVLPDGLSWNASLLNTTGVIRVSPTPKVATLVYDEGLATLTITGSGGEAFAAYRVLSSTDMNLPLGSWTQVDSGNFDGSGNFNEAITVTTSEAKRFYVVVYP